MHCTINKKYHINANSYKIFFQPIFKKMLVKSENKGFFKKVQGKYIGWKKTRKSLIL